MLVVVYGLTFLAGLMLNGSAVFLLSCGQERAIGLLWSLNLALVDIIFVSLLPLRVWSMSTSHDVLLRLSSSFTALHVVSRASFLAAMAACCAVAVASPARLETPQALKWALAASLVIWALSFAFSMRYHDLWEAATLSKDPQMDPDKWLAWRPLSTSFLIWFLGLLTLAMVWYSTRTSKQKTGGHAQSRELIRRPFLFLLTFFLCWLPYHILYFLLVTWLDATATSSPGFISGCQVAFSLPYLSCCCNAIICLSTIQDLDGRLQQSGGRNTPRHPHSEIQPLETLA